jgi:hypothetical protein
VTIAHWVDTALAVLPRTSEEERRRAARRVATEATSSTDAAELLAMLGLAAQDGLRPAESESGPALRESA